MVVQVLRAKVPWAGERKLPVSWGWGTWHDGLNNHSLSVSFREECWKGEAIFNLLQSTPWSQKIYTPLTCSKPPRSHPITSGVGKLYTPSPTFINKVLFTFSALMLKQQSWEFLTETLRLAYLNISHLGTSYYSLKIKVSPLKLGPGSRDTSSAPGAQLFFVWRPVILPHIPSAQWCSEVVYCLQTPFKKHWQAQPSLIYGNSKIQQLHSASRLLVVHPHSWWDFPMALVSIL
jgi:hypothetical protein